MPSPCRFWAHRGPEGVGAAFPGRATKGAVVRGKRGLRLASSGAGVAHRVDCVQEVGEGDPHRLRGLVIGHGLPDGHQTRLVGDVLAPTCS